MTADTMAERWGTVLDAVAFSPVRQQVTPAAIPAKVTPQLEATVKKLAKRVPHIASLFGATTAPASAPKPAESRPVPPPPPVEAAEAPPAPTPATDAAEAPSEPTPATEAPEAPAAPAEESADEQAPTEAPPVAAAAEEE